MERRRIIVTGAAGAGTTTLGRALASRLACPHHDTDDYFFVPTDPPYSRERPVPERVALMETMFLDRPDWVLSGSVIGWGEAVTQRFDLVIFLWTPPGLRISRIRDREVQRYGAEAIAPGGWRHSETEAFTEWAAGYDDDNCPGRNRAKHEHWLESVPCPVLRLEGDRPLAQLVEDTMAFISPLAARRDETV